MIVLKAFSLIGETQKLVNELKSLNLSNAFDVLEWFYKTIDFNSMFEDREISDYVYATLVSAGYTTNSDPVSDLTSFKKLMNSGSSASEMDIAESLIRQALNAIKEHHSLDMTLICLIQAFNEKYNKKFAYSYMMDNMKKCIGEKIVYTGRRNGEYFIETGVLTYVSDFKFFTVNGQEIEFFGDDVTILNIQSSTGEIIFNNNVPAVTPENKENIMQFS